MNPLTQFKKISILPLAITLALAAFAAPEIARGDAVTDWNAIASTAIAWNPGQSPHAAPLSFAMVHGAVYDAVNAIDRGYQPYLAQPPSNPTDSKEAATAAAAFRVPAGFPDLPGLSPGTTPYAAANLQCIHSGPAGQPAGVEDCRGRYR